MQSVTIGRNEAGQRLDKFLHKYLPNAGSGFLYKMLRKKNITLNGRRAEGNETLSQGDVVESFFSEETFAKFHGFSEGVSGEADGCLQAYETLQGITVLYEDADIVLLNKPAGILSQKAKDTDCSLNEWLIGYLLAHEKISQQELATFRPAVCNRLDRNTSGLVLCGKSLKGSQTLSALLKTHGVRKFYYTICAGAVTEEILLDGYLVKNGNDNTVTILRTSLKGEGSYIKTRLIPLAQGEKCTLLEVELFTGRPHQIRAHLASVGHPVIGDRKYGSPAVNALYDRHFGLKHQLLHAHHVIFPEGDILSGQTVTAPCPGQFIQIGEALGVL